jgi:hypothetical protein
LLFFGISFCFKFVIYPSFPRYFLLLYFNLFVGSLIVVTFPRAPLTLNYYGFVLSRFVPLTIATPLLIIWFCPYPALFATVSYSSTATGRVCVNPVPDVSV